MYDGSQEVSSGWTELHSGDRELWVDRPNALWAWQINSGAQAECLMCEMLQMHERMCNLRYSSGCVCVSLLCSVAFLLNLYQMDEGSIYDYDKYLANFIQYYTSIKILESLKDQSSAVI